MTKHQTIFIISDSSGATAQTVVQTAVSQFPNLSIEIKRYPFIQTESILKGILNIAKEKNAMIFHTLVNPILIKQVTDFAQTNKLYNFDCIQEPIDMISSAINEEPERVPGLVHDLNEDYFERISAIEFAVANDDGKAPRGLTKADVVILGVSRTSKTPLSLYLANQNIKVANVPIGPGLQLPDELKQVDKRRIFGLTNTPEKLSKIRKQRMLQYGLDAITPYSDKDNIKKELEYATKLYRQIGCLIINVSNKSIEETATIILESIDMNSIKINK